MYLYKYCQHVILASSFDSQQYSATYPVKSYNEWLLEHTNHTYAMAWHHKFMKTLQSGRKNYQHETKTQW